MLDFNYQNTTKILFGKNKVTILGSEIKKYADRVLLVYGGGSIKRNGLYDQVVSQLDEHQIRFKELPGIQANPRIDSVRDGVKLCREHDLQLVLAVGGGSVIDCSKAIAAGYYYMGDSWDFFTRKARVSNALPVASVLTLAATGSEMNGNAVISNMKTLQKIGIGNPALVPRFSILDPTNTFTVPANQTAAGVADIMSHVFEQYFSHTPGTYVQNYLAEGLLKTCIEMGPLAIREPENYEARANLMWAGTLALNGLIGTGKVQDWACHGMEHELSAMYDITHGLGLAIITPFWMDYVLSEETVDKFCDYARNVWGVSGENSLETAQLGITKTWLFFTSMGLASRLGEVGVEKSTLGQMAENATGGRTLGSFKALTTGDVLAILENAY